MDDSDIILDIVTYTVMSENNVMQYFEDYGYNHSLFSIDNFTDTTIQNRDIDTFIKT